jgi:hypothetical protein
MNSDAAGVCCDLLVDPCNNTFGVASMGPAFNPLNGPDAQGVWAWIDNYCHAHPLVQISEAASAFTATHPK